MPLSGVRYRVKTTRHGKRVRLAFRGKRVVEAKNLDTGATHTPEEFAADRQRMTKGSSTVNPTHAGPSIRYRGSAPRPPSAPKAPAPPKPRRDWHPFLGDRTVAKADEELAHPDGTTPAPELRRTRRYRFARSGRIVKAYQPRRVQRPGARGATKWYVDDRGYVRYGDRRPRQQPIRADGESWEAFRRRRDAADIYHDPTGWRQGDALDAEEAGGPPAPGLLDTMSPDELREYGDAVRRHYGGGRFAKAKGEQLGLFGGMGEPRKPVKEPGKRGGKWYTTDRGEIRYGQKPAPTVEAQPAAPAMPTQVEAPPTTLAHDAAESHLMIRHVPGDTMHVTLHPVSDEGRKFLAAMGIEPGQQMRHQNAIDHVAFFRRKRTSDQNAWRPAPDPVAKEPQATQTLEALPPELAPEPGEPQPREIPAGKMLVGEWSDPDVQQNKARARLLATGYSPRVKAEVRMIRLSPGYTAAGSIPKWTNGYVGVFWEMSSGGRNGRQYRLTAEGLDEAREHFARLTERLSEGEVKHKGQAHLAMLKKVGTAHAGEHSVKIVPHPIGHGFGVESTRAGERTQAGSDEPPMPLELAQVRAAEMLASGRRDSHPDWNPKLIDKIPSAVHRAVGALGQMHEEHAKAKAMGHRYEADVWDNLKMHEEIPRHLKTIETFRELAPRNNVDPEEALRAMGYTGPPELSPQAHEWLPRSHPLHPEHGQQLPSSPTGTQTGATESEPDARSLRLRGLSILALTNGQAVAIRYGTKPTAFVAGKPKVARGGGTVATTAHIKLPDGTVLNGIVELEEEGYEHGGTGIFLPGGGMTFQGDQDFEARIKQAFGVEAVFPYRYRPLGKYTRHGFDDHHIGADGWSER